MTSPSSRIWYHLVTAQVVYQVNGQPEISSMHLNGIVTTNTVNLPAASLGKAQQAVQMHFHQRHEGVDLKVLDVVITNLVNLGHMSPQEFHATPDGTELRMRPEASPTDTEASSEESNAQSKPVLSVVPRGDDTLPSSSENA